MERVAQPGRQWAGAAASVSLDPLERRRVLVIDDDPVVADLIQDMLVAFGCEPAGIVGDLDGALRHARDGGFDAALLDLNLGDRHSWPIADVLIAHRRPFVFVTGDDTLALSRSYGEVPYLRKPFRATDLRRALVEALAMAR